MRERLTTIAEAIGAALIVAGVAAVSIPAALVAAGIALITLSWAANR
jgi:hypothetical protein